MTQEKSESESENLGGNCFSKMLNAETILELKKLGTEILFFGITKVLTRFTLIQITSTRINP